MKRPTKKAPVKKPAKKAAPAKAAKAKPAPKKAAKPGPAPKKKPAKAPPPKAKPAKKAAPPAKKAAPPKKTAPAPKKPAAKPKKAAPAKAAPPKPAPGKASKPAPPQAKAPAAGKKGKALSSADHVKRLMAIRNGNGNGKAPEAKAPAKVAAPPAPPPPPPEPPPASPAVIAARARLAKRKAPYKAAELKELRDALNSERERLIEDLRVIDELATSNKETVNPTFSSHQADVATDSSSLETSFLQRRVAERRLSEVSEALRTMDSGRFGLCEACAIEPQGLCETCPYIPLDRLRAKPFAQMCVQLRRILEKNLVK